jgi:hypothetical protein
MVPIPRRWTRFQAPLFLLGLSAVLSASGCLSDVSVPPCVVDDSCGDGGAAGDSDSTAPFAGTSSGGTTQSHGGSGGTMPAMPNGGAAGEGDTETTGGMAGEQTCSSCTIFPATDLASPCVGSTYETTLSMRGGEPPLSWQITPAVAGWSIDVDPEDETRAIVTNNRVADGDTALTIKVTDSHGRWINRTFTLAPRTSCWFAFTVLGAQGPELRLLDPLARPPRPAPLVHNQGVYDFQFSPDGKRLAYTFGASATMPRGQHLAIVSLDTLQERQLSFGEDRITRFAWSPDSAMLAAAFVDDETTYLGAVRLPAAGSGDLPTSLARTPAFVESDLYWVGNRFVAYHAALVPDLGNPGHFSSENPFGLRTAFYSEVGVSGFTAQVGTLDTFPPDVVLQPSEDGFYMITSRDPYTIFTPLTGNKRAVNHWFISLVSPSGKYTALLDGSPLLQILSAEGGYFGARAAVAHDRDECPMPLGWAAGAERIACLADVQNGDNKTTHGEVRIFDRNEQSDTLDMATLGGFCDDDVALLNAASCTSLGNGYGYGTAQATGAARAFSASARWLAFASVSEGKSFLYWADLADRPLSLKGSVYFHDPGERVATRLAFSPDERWLLFQRGSQLTLHALQDGGSTVSLMGDLPKIEKCTDDFPTAPKAYCGNSDHTPDVVWAPDSHALAYRTPGALTVFEPRSESPLRTLPAEDCSGQCSGHFAFQPHP